MSEKTIVDTVDGRVFEDPDGARIFTTKTNCGFELQFNVNYIDDDKLHWFCQVVGRQYKEAIQKVVRNQQAAIRDAIKKALGL
jgi:hypothetical protein